MVLKPLEFSDCLADSPWFQQNLHEHEQALEDARKSIKTVEIQFVELVECIKKLSAAQRAFAKSLCDLKIETVGTTQTDDERAIANCLKDFGRRIKEVEDHRTKLIEDAEACYIPLRKFRLDRIGKVVNEEKKKYEKESQRFYASLEKYLHLSTVRKNDFREADAQLGLQQRNFGDASLQYVAEIQAVQERMKFELVETLGSFLYSWLTFYHVGHVIQEDFKPFLDGIQIKVQKAKENFRQTKEETEELRKKMLNSFIRNAVFPSSSNSSGNNNNNNSSNGGFINDLMSKPTNSNIKQGYVYLQEKSKIPKGIGRDVLPRNWTKYYCVYQKETRIFTMIPVNSTVKTDMKGALEQSVSFKLKSCIRRASDSIDKRFCFDLISDERDTMTFQALSEEDRRQWLDAMDGREPVYSPGTGPHNQGAFETVLDDAGFDFVRECLKAIEGRGITEQGLYRNCGVTSKVQKLMQIALDKKKFNSSSTKNQLNLCSEDSEWEIKTISSAVKTFLRNLPEPLMTFELHSHFINAAKMDDGDQRVDHIHYYVYKLPESHRNMLKIVLSHLKKVADMADENLMTVGNLGVCFGPTLLRPKEETVTAIMDIKFCNVVVEVLIANYEKIFNNKPPISLGTPCPPKPVHNMVQIMPPASTDSSCLLFQSTKNTTKNLSQSKQGSYQSPNGSQQLSVYDNYSPRQFESQSAEDLTTNTTLLTNSVKMPVSQQVSPAGNCGRLFNLRRPKPASQGISGNSLTSNTSVDIVQNISNCSLNEKSHTSSDSLNSTSSERSTGVVSQKISPLANSTNVDDCTSSSGLSKNKMTSSYAPHYNPQASETLSRRLKKRHSGGNLSSVTTSNLTHTTIYPSSSLSQPYYDTLSTIPYSISNLQSTPLPGLKNSILTSSSSIPSNVAISFNNGYPINESTFPYFSSLINPNSQIQPSRRVRTLYECTAGHETELSFSPGQIITNVYESKEEGWLVGTLNGKTGLIPSNYCEPLP
ncbi:GRAF ortholog [Strongyloides ratti]|uniref:GRAF ortholog n=1 Tax=Strongyloides ratti TaxID=34506 RepID=A0A090LLG2_STRRB|nr:GRAF ortholog [Strongyloides ratti]CEF68380.1 GRAF ortholog [Strongyloides ratti]